MSFFPRGVLSGILNLIKSVSEGFPSYSTIKHDLCHINYAWLYIFYCFVLF